MPGAAVDQPARGLQPEATEPPGDEMRAFGIGCEGRRGSRRFARHRRREDDDLADVTGALHEAKGLDRLARGDGAVGEGREHTVREEGHDLLEQRLPGRVVLQDELVEVDAEIRQIPAERLQADMRVGDIVALAELDKTTERLQHRDAALHGLARQAVQHHGHAIAGHAADVVDELVRAAVEDVFGTERHEEVAAFGGPGGRDHPRPSPARDLQRGEADAARAAMDQHPLLFFEAGTADQCVIGREKRDRHGGGRDRGKALRNGRDDPGIDRHMGRKSRLGEGEHGVACLEAGSRRPPTRTTRPAHSRPSVAPA